MKGVFKSLVLLSFVFMIASCKLYHKTYVDQSLPKGIDTLSTESVISDSLFVEQEDKDEGFRSDTISEDLNEIRDLTVIPVDSLSILHSFLSDTMALAKVFKNKYSHYDNISEDHSMLTGSALVHQLDQLAEVKFFNKYEFETDRSKLNKYGFASNYTPSYSDSTYAFRIELLNIQTPMQLIYNKHVKTYIRVYTKKGKGQTSRMLGLKEIYFPIFEEVLDKYNLPLELKYLAVVESALNPTAGSHAGAKGLWQFMYATGKRYGLTNNSMVDDRFDPYKATEAAVLHLKDLYDIYHSWELALAAYNSGPGNVNRAIRRAGGIKDYWAIWPYLPRETRGYVPAFIAVNYVFSYATEHNIFPTDPGILHYNIDSVSVKDVLSFEQISEYLHIDIEDIKFLNPAYKLGIIPATRIKPYILRLPRSKVGQFLDHEYSIYHYKSSKGIEREKLLTRIKEASEKTIYRVRSGDNLGSIARKYHTSVRNIKSWNNLRNSRIYAGQKITIYPSGKSIRSKNSSKDSTHKMVNNKGGQRIHKVRKGETLGHIAQQYGVSVNALRRWNGIRGSRLSIGQKLSVKASSSKSTQEQQQKEEYSNDGSSKYYKIRQGDTLWDLARKYGVTVAEIKKWNGISNSHRLKLGERLIIGKI